MTANRPSDFSYRLAAAILFSSIAFAEAAAAEGQHARPRGVDLDALLSLTTHEGKHLDRSELRGKPLLLVFGYTSCPEVCPTSLMDMTLNLQELHEDADRVRVFFVTADPERDTAERLKAFLTHFDARITGLTGRLQDIETVAVSFGATILQGDKTKDYYSVDHTASTMMVDKYGLLSQVVPYGDREGLLKYSRRLLAQ